MKTIKVEIPIEHIAERYLRCSGNRYMFSMRQLNREPTDFHSLEIQDVHSPTGETRIRFVLSNGPTIVRDVVLSLAEIFDGPKRMEELFAMVKRLDERCAFSIDDVIGKAKKS